MITSSTWFLAVHVLAALWLAAGIFGATVVRARTRRAASGDEALFGLGLLWRLTAVFTLPGLVVSGLLGFHLVAARGYAFTEKWVSLSAVLWLAMLVLTLALIVPAQRRAARVVASEARAAAGAKLAGILEHLNALALLVVTLLMALKPG